MAWNSCNFISAARSLYVRLLKTNPAHLFSVVSKLFHLYKRIPSKNQQQWNLKIMEKIRGAEFFSCFFFCFLKLTVVVKSKKKKIEIKEQLQSIYSTYLLETKTACLKCYQWLWPRTNHGGISGFALLLMKERGSHSIKYKQIEVRLGPGCGVQWNLQTHPLPMAE